MRVSDEVNQTVFDDEMLERVYFCPYCYNKDSNKEVSGVKDYFFEIWDGEFDFLRCLNCNALWMASRPQDKYVELAYEDYYTHDQTNRDDSRNANIFKNTLRDGYVRNQYGRKHGFLDSFCAAAYQALSPNLVDTRISYRFAPRAPCSILDFGCGGGHFLRKMRSLGNEVVGIDFDRVVIERLQEEGIEAFLIAELDWLLDNYRFDLIALGHVIEHIPNPGETIAKLAASLNEDGLIYIEAPNASATGLEIFGKYWRGLEAPRHFGVPSLKSLELVCNKAGLQIDGQFIPGHARRWVWEESLGAVPKNERASFEIACRQAPPETEANAEFLAVTARKPQ